MATKALRPPTTGSLDGALDRFETFSVGLVKLEPYPLRDLRRTVKRFASLLESHVNRGTPPAGDDVPGHRLARLAKEHERFRTSVTQLRDLLDVVEQDDHGGHRQALGQYGKILVEALRIHRTDERQLEAAMPPLAAGPASASEPRRKP